jgi:hypothetical protein
MKNTREIQAEANAYANTLKPIGLTLWQQTYEGKLIELLIKECASLVVDDYVILEHFDIYHKYRILKTIVLGFLTHNDSYELIIEPGNGYIKFRNEIIYVDKKGVERVSHTMNSAIDIWLEQGILEAE